MAGHPLDVDPAPSVNPTGAPGNDFEHIDAGPEKFGGFLGQAEQKLGAGIQNVGEAGLEVLTQRQGMLNETYATNGETGYMTDLGKLEASYKSKEGLDAVAAKPQYDADVAALRQKYLTTMPTVGAQRAFNLLALRHEGFALQDSSGYSAQQLKKADLDSANASSGAAIAATGSYSVASNDQRFQDQLHSIDFATRRQMQNQGWGSAMHEDQNHNLTFDDSPQGQQAKAVYDATNGKALSMAYVNRFEVLADRNVISANDLYQKERDKVPGEAQVHLDAFFTPKVRDAQVSGISQGVVTNADQQFGQSQQKYADVADAIHMQESGGKYNAKTSVTGAMGGWQIQPDTFARYSKPGERINNPADNEAVGRRIVSDLSQKYNGDPARVAVAYFSGEGNVAPPGNPTPWKQDRSDPTGKSVSSYVNDIMGRMTGQNVPSQVQSKADYYRVHFSDILEDTRSRAEALHPDDPRFADMSVARVEQNINNVIRQQELSYKADNDIVQKAFTGAYMQGGKRPTTIEQMIGGNPDVKSAWERMQIQNPIAAEHIANQVLTANSKEGDHDVKTYGQGFYDLFRKVHAPAGDPDRITNPDELYKHVGENGDLTVSGVEKLTSEINTRRSPEGEAESEMKKQFLANARGQITGANLDLHMKDQHGDELYLKFLANVLPKYDQERKEGKTPEQLLNPESPDYVGKAIKSFVRNPTQWSADVYNDNAPDVEKPAAAKTYENVQDLIADYRAGKVTKADADAMALAKGWGTRKPQQPSLATAPQVPLSQ